MSPGVPALVVEPWEPEVCAVTVVFSVLIHFIRAKGRGRPKQPQVVPDPRLRYGQVVNTFPPLGWVMRL
jgi:hypothetical protein